MKKPELTSIRILDESLVPTNGSSRSGLRRIETANANCAGQKN